MCDCVKFLQIQSHIRITYTTAVSGFADIYIYTFSPWVCGPHALGVYISKIPHSHGITIKLDNKNY